MSVRALLVSLCAVATVVSAAPKKPKAAPAPAVKKVTLEKDVQPFFNTSCVMCHIPGVANGEMILEEGDAFKALVNAKATGAKGQLRVVPGQPDQSYLLRKLKGTHKDVNGAGERMPMGGAQVSDATLATIAQWIADGALEK